MIDPQKITKFDRTEAELEELLVFVVAVAAKTALATAQAVDRFLKTEPNLSPFDAIRKMIKNNCLRERIQSAKLGKWTVLEDCYSKIVESGIDLKTCSVADLEKFKGIGKKTSRYFVLHSRANQNNIACIDRHAASWLKEQGITGDYDTLEAAFIKIAKEKKLSVAELDLMVWNARSKRSGTQEPLKI